MSKVILRSVACLACGALLLFSATNATAQLGNTVRNLLNGDSLAPPDYDTTYITNYRSDLVISVLARYQLIDVDLEQDEGDGLSYSTNTNEQYGFGINYKWLSAEVTFNVPALDQYDPAFGKTTSKGFGLGYTGRRLWLRGFWSNATGYYLNDPQRWISDWNEGDAQIVRPDLSSTTYLLSGNYALSNKRRYSQNAALFQLERQKRSAGTFVVGLSGWLTTVEGDSSLIRPALVDTFRLATGFTSVDRTLINASFGYTHTFAFWTKGFINVAVMPGLAYARQTITTTTNEKLSGTGVASATEFKFGAGFNGDRWYTAITTSVYYSTSAIAEELSLATNYVFARFALGIRLGGPRSGMLQKIGL
ncbi:MAG: DUF4421 family protein [Flavobacteriales bacterium]